MPKKQTKRRPKEPLLDNGDLSHKLQAALEAIFVQFDADGDGALNTEELQAFARACNDGDGFQHDEMVEIKNIFDVTEGGALTCKGFLQMYHTQTVARPQDTWRDLRALGFDTQLTRVDSGTTGALKASPSDSQPAKKSDAAVGDLMAHCDKSDRLYTAGKHQDALRAAMSALQLNEQSAVAHRCVGRALFALGRVDAAERSWKRAIELDGSTSASPGSGSPGSRCSTGAELEDSHTSPKQTFAADVDPSPAIDPAGTSDMGNASSPAAHDADVQARVDTEGPSADSATTAVPTSCIYESMRQHLTHSGRFRDRQNRQVR